MDVSVPNFDPHGDDMMEDSDAYANMQAADFRALQTGYYSSPPQPACRDDESCSPTSSSSSSSDSMQLSAQRNEEKLPTPSAPSLPAGGHGKVSPPDIAHPETAEAASPPPTQSAAPDQPEKRLTARVGAVASQGADRAAASAPSNPSTTEQGLAFGELAPIGYLYPLAAQTFRLDVEVCQAYFLDLLEKYGDPQDPIEKMLVQEIALAFHHAGHYLARASASSDNTATLVFGTLSTKLMAEFRRLTLALKEFRKPDSDRQRQRRKSRRSRKPAGTQQSGLPEKIKSTTELGSDKDESAVVHPTENGGHVEADQKKPRQRTDLTAEGRERLRAAAIENKPWLHSTGPTSINGKAAAAANGRSRQKTTLSRRQMRAEIGEALELLEHSAAIREIASSN